MSPIPSNFCEIMQTVDDPLLNAQVGKPVVLLPTQSPLFVNTGGTWVEILNISATVSTDNSGTTTILLPYPSICYPNTVQWKYTTPDGFVFQGVVPSVAGPLTLKDLLVTYSWTHTP